LPYTGATEFVGREADLQKLHDRLQESNLLAITAIQGMGGIGKTELALQYAYSALAQDQYPGGVCWLRSREDISTQIVGFARVHLDLSLPTELDLSQQVAYCWSHWREGKALLIWDDVTDYAEVQPYLPPRGDRFQILLTTRVDLGASVRQLRLEVLREEAALDLLRAIVTQGGEVEDLRFLEEIGGLERQLCQWVGYLPLGLELVGRYLARRKEVSIATLLQRLQEKRLEARALLQAEPGMTASLGVAAAFELSWQELKPSAKELAAWLSLFALAPIAWTLVQACLPEWDEEDLEDVRDEELLGLHLLQPSEAGIYQLHQLLREFFAAKRQQMPAEAAMQQTLCRVMVAEAEQIPQTPTLDLIAQFTPLIPHLEEVATALTDCLTDDDLITPYTRIAWFYEGQAAYAQAQPWLEQCRATAETRLGKTHPAVATSLNNLALLYQSTGRYSDAEPLLVRSLQINEQQLGADHPDTAQSLNNLAELYVTTGRYSDAEPLLVRSLQINEQQLGADHPDTAQSLNILAGLYKATGRYSDAEPLLVRSLQIREQQLGANHPDTALSLNNLALLYDSTGRYSDAEPLYLRAVVIFHNRLGETHPTFQTVWGNFIAFLRQAIQAGQTAQLSEHPMTQDVLEQLRRS
jgi:tetratricopeptide (TPR) repeat protein